MTTSYRFVNLAGKDRLSCEEEGQIPFRSTLFVKLYNTLIEVQSENVSLFNSVDSIFDDLANTDVLYDTVERKILGYLNYRIDGRVITINKLVTFSDVGSYIISHLKDRFNCINVSGSGRQGVFLFILEGFKRCKCSHGEIWIWNK